MTDVRRSPRLVRWALSCCPRSFRAAHADEILADATDRLDAERGLARLRLHISLALDLLGAAYRLRRHPEMERPIFSDRSQAGFVTGTLDGLYVDLRAAIRGLLRTPGHSLTIVLTLALALGLAIDVFGVFHGVLLQPLQWESPEELVYITAARAEQGIDRTGTSGGDFFDVREQVSSFEDVAALTVRRQNLTGLDSPASQVYVGWTSGNLFALLGVEASHGRVFRDGEDPEVVLISSELWRERFGSDPQVLGRRVELDGWPYSIVGVLPAGFRMELPGRQGGADLWRLPDDRWANGDLWSHDSRSARILHQLGRLRDGADLDDARQQLAALSSELRGQVAEYAEWGWTLRAEPLHETLVEPARPLLSLLLGSAAFVLAIACANIMHLVLVRAQGRAAELGMRLALGAPRLRLVRLLLLENLLLAGTAGALGFGLALAGQRVLTALRPEGLPRFDEVGLGSPTLLFASCAVVTSTLLFGLWPAWRAAGTDLSKWMRGWRSDRRSGVGPWLVSTEVALSLVLLTGAGLLLQSLLHLRDVDPGFAVDDIYSFSVSLPSTRYDFRAGETGVFLQRLERQIEALPGVVGAAPVWPAPLVPGGWGGDLETPGGTARRAEYRIASNALFELTEIPILDGRLFSAVDERGMVVVSRSLAESMWPGRTALGRTLEASPWGAVEEFEVIGVVADAQLNDLRESPEPQAYFDAKYWSWADWEIHWIVKTEHSDAAAVEASLVPALRDRVAALDSLVPLADPRPLRHIADDQMSLQRFALALVGVFAGVAAVLSAVGLYGVVAYSVSRRRREMGIRMALGSARADIVSLVVRHGGRWIAAGLVAGLGGAVLLSQSLESLLFQVGARDPRTLAAVSAVVASIGLVACLVPALRASRVDPATVLRSE